MIAQVPCQDERKTGYQWLQPLIDEPGFHPGEDLNSGKDGFADLGLPVKPMAKGKVIYKVYTTGWGNLLVIEHEHPTLGKFWTRYAHFQKIYVKVNDTVDIDDTIGLLGKSGTRSPHLHWEVIIKELPYWTSYVYGWSEEKVKEYFASPYEFIKKINGENKPSSWAKEPIEKAIKSKVAVVWDNSKEVVGNATLGAVLYNLGATKKRHKKVTKEVLIVALDNLNLLDE